MSATAETGAKLLNGQGRTSASNSAVAAAPGRRYDRTTREASPSFWAQRRRWPRRDSLL